jgi:hypothetical protein
MSWGKTTGRLREDVHAGPEITKGLESYRRNTNFLQRKTITKPVFEPHTKSCGKGLAPDEHEYLHNF